MLIDRSYFVGELNIPNTATQGPTQERLEYFIRKYEKELLIDIMGYSLYSEFANGLQANPIATKWTDLLTGAEYEYSGKTHYWNGIIEVPAGVSLAISAQTSFTVTVGGVGTYDPPAGQSSMTIPPSMVGKAFTITQRGYGQLLPSEFTVVGNILTLTGGIQFSAGDTFFINYTPLSAQAFSGTDYKSFIANYVYCHFIRNEATQTVGIGEVRTKAENAERVSPIGKMVRAWNEMSEKIWWMRTFLNANITVYDTWEDDYWKFQNKYSYINEFGI